MPRATDGILLLVGGAFLGIMAGACGAARFVPRVIFASVAVLFIFLASLFAFGSILYLFNPFLPTLALVVTFVLCAFVRRALRRDRAI